MTRHTPPTIVALWRAVSSRPWFWLVIVVAAYGVSRLPALTALPVFADEAIYLRWAQLWRHDLKYLFFSLNDGKPPLFFWLLGGMLSLPGDPLWLGRLLSVFTGLGTLAVLDRVVQKLGGDTRARLANATIILLAPFWFFHHRMALLDSLLTLLLATSWLAATTLSLPSHAQTLSSRVGWSALLGLSFGGALLTKTPALFAIPIIALWSLAAPWLETPKAWKRFDRTAWLKNLVWVALGGGFGCALFLLLRLQPTFGSLFSRSGDFSFTLSEVLAGAWRTSIDNAGRILSWVAAYLRPEIVALAFMAPLVSRRRWVSLLMLISALILAGPFMVFGRTLHPRYLLPVAPFLTVSASLLISEASRRIRPQNQPMELIFAALVGVFIISGIRFQLLSFFTPDQTPFVLADREQYLTEWSSGHGIPEIRDRLRARAAQGEYTVVVTEGSFGTLPDGLLLYFDNDPAISHLKIEGLAQYPVKFLPDWVWEEAKTREVWLVVNEHRMEADTTRLELIGQYPRPYGAPELHLYRVRPEQVE